MLELPIYVDPSSRNYSAYSSYIKQFNVNLQSRVTKYLAEELSINPHSRIAIMITGSDGRLEKGPQSRIDLVVLKENMPSIDGIVGSVESITELNSGKSIFEDTEIKDLENDSMSFYKNQRDRTFPGRIIESELLAGNDYLGEKSRMKLYNELVGPDGKSIKDKTKDKEKEYRKIMLSGKQTRKGEEIEHFDMDSGMVFYDPEDGIFSFKYGPLRFIQLSFISDIVNFSRQKQRNDLITGLPPNIEDRFYELENLGLSGLPNNQVVELIDNYKFFLWMYHLSQSKYKQEGHKEMGFDRQEVKERINSISKILDKGIIKMD